ncbi:MAG: AgmX/PglI C-terminal domain-containing protein [Deltaproteobacteria bacterium]|nr:AgmX/PglI C-terminal domain-containing protein [Deltaproteobacteria bacterium]
MKIPVGIEKVLYFAAVDPAFREALFADRSEALSRPGVNLLPDETAVLKCIPDDRLEMMIAQIDPAAHGRRFMQKVAACAVALAATTAGAGCKPGQASPSTKDVGLSVGSAPVLTYKPKVCETENAAARFVEAADFGDQRWSWGTGGIRSDRPSVDGIEVNVYGESGEGEIDQRQLSAVVDSCQTELNKCLKSPLFKDKDLFGKIDVAVRMRKNGLPVEVLVEEDSICEPSLTKCVVDVFKKKRYPKPRSKAAQIHVSLSVNKALHFDKNIEIRAYASALETEGLPRNGAQMKIDWHREILAACYRNALRTIKDLRGEAKFRLTLNEDGTVTEVSTVTVPQGGEHLAKQLMPWLGREKFEKPDRMPASVTVTFAFDHIPRESIDVALGASGVAGNVDPGKVDEVLRSRIRSIKDCYLEERWSSRNLAGEIAIDLLIDQDGRVTAANATKDLDGNAVVSRCLLARMKDWRFPKPDSGVATISFTLKSSKKK